MDMLSTYQNPRFMRRFALGVIAFAAMSGSALASPTTGDTPAVASTLASTLTVVQTGESPVKLAQKAISPAQAKAIARRRVPGATYNDISRKGNIYRVRLLKEGRVVDVAIDASTGRVLSVTGK